jgi:hypothetical protein
MFQNYVKFHDNQRFYFCNHPVCKKMNRKCNFAGNILIMEKIITFLRNHYALIYKVVLFLATLVLIVSFFPRTNKFQYEYTQGKPWMYSDFIAPYDFPIYKTAEEIEKEKNDMLKSMTPYFFFDEEVYRKALHDYEVSFQREFRKAFPKQDSLREVIFNQSYHLLDSVLKAGIIQYHEVLKGRHDDFSIYIIKNNIAQETEVGDVLSITKADYLLRKRLHAMLSGYESAVVDFVYSRVQAVLVQTIKYDFNKNQVEIDEALKSLSLTRGMVQKGQRIISKGEMVTGHKFQLLNSFKRDFLENNQLNGNSNWIATGQAIVVSLLLLNLLMFSYFFRYSVYAENKKLLFILFVFVLTFLMTSLVVKYNPAYLYVVPIAIAPIIIRVFFDARLAILIHTILVLLLGFQAPDSFDFVVMNIIVGMIAVMSLINLNKRGQFYVTSFWIFLTYALVYTGIHFWKEGSYEGLVWENYLMFAASATLTLFAYLLVYVFEKAFKMVTDITLLELSNTSNPVLRELSSNAPGTFQHSMQVANLAEEAIREIGGNALLVRAGAMFHDIGKLVMPQFFVENQQAGHNPHDDLSSEESARIIVSHVIKGIEMARKRGLPEPILDFIRTHHGTRKADYFYLTYKQQNPDETFDETVFTYPGPKPFSKETAVVMIADSVEAASRSLNAPDENKIDKLVDGIIDKLFEERQLVNADITLKELKNVGKVLKRQLMNIHHVRMVYPSA